MPRRMVLCARPVAALTAVIPPRPSETASTAAQRRRPRSVNSSARPWYLVSIHRTIRWSIMREIVTNSPHRSQCRVRAINYARRLTGYCMGDIVGIHPGDGGAHRYHEFLRDKDEVID